MAENFTPALDDYIELQRVRFQELFSQAEDDVIKQMGKVYVRNELSQGRPTSEKTKMALEVFGPPKLIKEKEVVVSSKWFITITAMEKMTDVVPFFNQMKKVLLKAPLKGTGFYVIEQRSVDDEVPYGYHIHWRVQLESEHAKGFLVQQIYQCFRSYLTSRQFVDLRPWNDNQMKYINGEKTKSKMPRVLKDEIIRKRYSLPEIVSY